MCRLLNRFERCGSPASLLIARCLLAVVLASSPGFAQEQDGQSAPVSPADSEASAAASPESAPATSPDSDDSVAPEAETSAVPPAPARRIEPINIMWLLVQGGWFMVPILLVSLMVVTFAIERAFGLRRTRLLPPSLVAELGRLGTNAASFDPRQAYRICQQYPSAAANVVRAMLLKVGRPHSEVEHTVAETSEREANRVYANVRWINLGTSVAPLLGLLGTVWGMIVCFHDTTQLDPGQNKAEFLANGIYIALVTTLAGLCVAIPAAIIAHFFEGRIQAAFHQIDELVFSLLPQIERFEGRVRFSRQSGDGNVRESGPEPPVQERASSHR